MEKLNWHVNTDQMVQPQHDIENHETFTIYSTSGSDICNINDKFEEATNSHGGSSDQAVAEFQPPQPLGASVSDELKNKLWSDEHVNLDLLLSNNAPYEGLSSLTVQRDANNRPMLAFMPQTSSKKIITIDHWVSAFRIFMNVYCQKNKNAIDDVIGMVYCATIQQLQFCGKQLILTFAFHDYYLIIQKLFLFVHMFVKGLK